jgi:hypothetical protein
VPVSDEAASRTSFARGGDVVQVRRVDPFSQSDPTEGVSASKEASELDSWWRPTAVQKKPATDRFRDSRDLSVSLGLQTLPSEAGEDSLAADDDDVGRPGVSS